MATQIKLRRNTAAGWTSANPVLEAGEPGFEKDTGRVKIGNGTDNWNTLPYASGQWGEITGTLSNQTDLQTALNLKISTSTKGAANGVAPLDSNSKVPAANLPSYVDDVLEYANLAAFPGTGATGIIYVALDTGHVYRWTGSIYTRVADSAATADKLTIARSIGLGGEASGSANFDGSGNITINATIFPSQTSNNGKFLQTDGSAVSWQPAGGVTLSDVAASATYYLSLTGSATGIWTDGRTDAANLYYTSGDDTLYATNINQASDARLKENVQTVVDAVGTIQKLRGVSFNWKNNKNKSYGVVAQELEQVIPELVSELMDRKSVNYIALIGILIEAIKEQQKQIDELKEKQNGN